GQRRRRCRKRAVVTGSSGTAKPRHTTATLASAPALDLRPEAGKLHGPSRAQGVCVQPAMDGRRPALGAGRGQAGGARPPWAGRAARRAAEKCAACAAHTRTEKGAGRAARAPVEKAPGTSGHVSIPEPRNERATLPGRPYASPAGRSATKKAGAV